MSIQFMEQFLALRRTSTPLAVIQTPDPQATVNSIATDKDTKACPMILWDCVRGVIGVALNPTEQSAGKVLARELAKKEDPQTGNPMSLCDPVAMLGRATEMPRESILFMSNLHLHFNDPRVVQGIWNLRDAFKQNTRTLLILCPAVKLPAILAQDVLVMDEPLPTNEQLAGIVGETYAAANVKPPTVEILSRAVDNLCGLAAFPAEQVCAMSIRKTGMDLDQLLERKRQQIEQQKGLKVWRGTNRFKDIGGCENKKAFLMRIANGRERPRAIIFQDEIEKQYAGVGSEVNGTASELLGNQLTFMQDHDSTGIMSIGHPGVAKSEIAKAFGNEVGIPTIQLDLGNAKGSLVGESNENMQNILKVIEAVSQGRALWFATCNNIQALPAELRNRYTFGTFFYDLPTPSERAMIWNIYFEKYGITDRDKPADTGWNGREIKNCCLMAYRLNIPLKEAANYIVSISVSAKERILELRKEANGRYISAAYPGPYKAPAEIGDEEESEKMVVAVAVMNQPKRKIDLPPTGGKGKPN